VTPFFIPYIVLGLRNVLIAFRSIYLRFATVWGYTTQPWRLVQKNHVSSNSSYTPWDGSIS